MLERDWQNTVVALAKALDWRVYHTHDSRRSDPGFPDLVLVRDRIVYAELKNEAGRLSKAQADWRNAIQAAGGTWFLWRPDDYEDVRQTLRRRHA
jgi:hypothetical protein